MAHEGWTWAELDDRQLALIREAEQTLGTDVIVAYRTGDARIGRAGVSMPPAELNASQLECLRGVEGQIGCVAVAYERRG